MSIVDVWSRLCLFLFWKLTGLSWRRQHIFSAEQRDASETETPCGRWKCTNWLEWIEHINTANWENSGHGQMRSWTTKQMYLKPPHEKTDVHRKLSLFHVIYLLSLLVQLSCLIVLVFFFFVVSIRTGVLHAGRLWQNKNKLHPTNVFTGRCSAACCSWSFKAIIPIFSTVKQLGSNAEWSSTEQLQTQKEEERPSLKWQQGRRLVLSLCAFPSTCFYVFIFEFWLLAETEKFVIIKNKMQQTNVRRCELC